MAEETKQETKPSPTIYNLWRPTIAYTYAAVCLSDFILFPLLFGPAWRPLTIGEGSHIYHMSMMAIIGVSSYGRSFGYSTDNGKVQAKITVPDK